MRIGVPKERHTGERRVATTPEIAEKLQKIGFSVAIESGAGLEASFSDQAYKEAGVEVIEDVTRLWAESDIILKVRAPEPGGEELSLMHPGCCLISFIWPGQQTELMQQLAERQISVIAMDSVPRMSRAQKMDALSSMANIAGYRAIIEAAHEFGRFFCGQVTAAGKVPPAKVFVIGAGVAGLAAIGAANGLGAIVRATDTRPEVADQVKSMGAEFISVDYKEEGAGVGGYAKQMSEGYILAQQAMVARQVADADIVVTTALIPGKPAPRLITAQMVASMRAGSVIVDMAAEQGGNCELTAPGQVVVREGVTLIGYTDLPSRLSRQSSSLYATNLLRLLEELSPAKDGQIHINMEDEVIRGATVILDGAITWPPPPPRLSAAPTPDATRTNATPLVTEKQGGGCPGWIKSLLQIAIATALFLLLGAYAPASFMAHFTVFVLACFIGNMVIWNVTAALHTPLMSVTNAISSIIAIGALIQISSPGQALTLMAGVAIALTAVNMAGGFWVTQRMLRMFRK